MRAVDLNTYLLIACGLFMRVKSQWSFSTLVFCWSVARQFPEAEIQTQSIFDKNGIVNPKPETIIRQTLESSSRLISMAPFLNEKKFQAFLKYMNLQPESEKAFHFIKTTALSEQKPGDVDDGTRTITYEINQSVGVNVFNEFNVDETTYRMIPSLSMMQQFFSCLWW